MRIGLVPGQVEALRAAFAEQRRQLTRRGLFVAAGSSVIAGACGYTAGRAHHDAVPESPALVDPVRALALGDLDELRRQAMHIDAALERTPDDLSLGLAFQRLLTLAIAHREDEALARRLLRISERPGMPKHIVEGGQLLRRLRGR